MTSYLFTSHLDFEYDGAAETLFSDLTVQLSSGWTGIVGANGSGKTTLLRLFTGELKPDSGSVGRSGQAVLCRQDIQSPPGNMNELFSSHSIRAFRLLERLSLNAEMAERWNTLSLGERKKIQIAAALFAEPDILCIDEPTNHLDASGRVLLEAELRSFRGIGVLVSHDRELLDRLCGQCLFLENGNAVLRSGNFSTGREQGKIELENRLDSIQQMKRKLRRDKLELQRRREKEQQARNKDCKRKLDRHDHDNKGKIDAARISGRDRKQGDLAKLQRSTVERTEAGLDMLGKAKIHEFGLKIPYGEYSSKNILLDMPSGCLPLGAARLEYPALSIGSHDRIALTGDNGAGKSTLLRRMLGELKLNQNEYLYMPQELNDVMTSKIHRELQTMPRDAYSKVMNVVASLGSRPERVLDSTRCSPGEWRKLFFGLGVLRKVHLIVLDEPTNHLDLPSIECLEAALAECSSSLLLIRHDMIFLKKLCRIHWEISPDESKCNLLRKSFF